MLILESSKIFIFSQGLVHDFGEKFGVASLDFSRSIRSKGVFCDILDTKKKTFLDYKNVDIRKWKKLDFFAKGLLHDFGQKF